MKTAFIICGALAREVLDIIKRHGWDVQVFGIPAVDHVFPDRIAPHVEQRLRQIKADFDQLLVVFGDCGSQGALDQLLADEGIERIDGPHCYEMYGGDTFHNLMEEEPGTFFLTDFLVRGFHGTIVKSMGLDRFPELRDEYFRNYKRVLFLNQVEEPGLLEKAREAADFLGLPLEVRHTGYGLLEQRLVEKMSQFRESAA